MLVSEVTVLGVCRGCPWSCQLRKQTWRLAPGLMLMGVLLFICTRVPRMLCADCCLGKDTYIRMHKLRSSSLTNLSLRERLPPPVPSLPRPINRAVTLVPHVGEPKIRNLELGNSKISVTNANQSNASRAAHATAKITGAPPAGMPAASPGCKCACTVS